MPFSTPHATAAGAVLSLRAEARTALMLLCCRCAAPFSRCVVDAYALYAVAIMPALMSLLPLVLCQPAAFCAAAFAAVFDFATPSIAEDSRH